ncbi:Strictosidine synthase, conserved region [Dillenia turbinata]|uniref:Strictosidine synthase, conserved region n=1 Tax=Dillenia turbinata TaxID=194707 RepID=A0AAN8UTP9_9MAGN
MRTSFASLFFFTCFVCLNVETMSYEQKADARLKNYHQIELAHGVGPESIDFDCKGEGPYTGVSDGRILKWNGPQIGWKEFAIPSYHRNREMCDGNSDKKLEHVCGRPLGIKFNKATCDLYIADAYFGLLKVGPRGGQAQTLATSAAGVPFKLVNGLDIDPTTGLVYFTDSSTVYRRWEYLTAVLRGDKTGRLMRYDPRSKKVTVLLNGLAFANGVALSKNMSFILVAETGEARIMRYWLQGPKAHTHEVFAELGIYPDNIKVNQEGEFWVALTTGTEDVGKKRLAGDADAGITVDTVAVKLDRVGQVMEMIDASVSKTLQSVSEVEEHLGKLWIGSVDVPYVGLFEN